jgi:hypothetical protein
VSVEVDRRQKTEDSRGDVTRVAAPFCLLTTVYCLLAFAPGCTQPTASTTQPTDMRSRQDAAMKDPFGYSPNAGKTDISGGGLTDFDRDGFQKDLKNVLDP